MKLDRKKFETWLRSKPADQIVGQRRDGCGCPLASFHAEASGGWEVTIFSDDNGLGYVINRGNGNRRLPEWADAFAFLVDRNDGDSHKISAGRALEILKEVAR